MLILVCVIEPVYPVSQLTVLVSDPVLQVGGFGVQVLLVVVQAE